MSHARQAGFTLIETLVALIILALAAGALQLCLSAGWTGVRVVRGEQAALQLARAKLAEAGVETRLAEGTEDGETEAGFAWTREVRARPTPGAALQPAALAGYWVTVTVSWHEKFKRDRTVSLTTLKLGRAQ